MQTKIRPFRWVLFFKSNKRTCTSIWYTRVRHFFSEILYEMLTNTLVTVEGFKNDNMFSDQFTFRKNILGFEPGTTSVQYLYNAILIDLDFL